MSGPRIARRPLQLAEPAFVGRKDVLERVRPGLQAARQGSAQFMLIEADSGGGKTRMLDEVARHYEGQAAVFRAQAPAEAILPLMLFEALVTDVQAQLAEDPDLRARIRDNMHGHAETFAAVLPAARRLLSPVAVSAQGPEAYAADRLVPALAKFLLSLGTPQRPALLLLDDVQWLDETSWQALDCVAARAQQGESQVMIVAASRPDAKRRAHPHFVSVTPLVLPPLPASDMHALVTSMADGLSAKAVDLVCDLSEGSPLLAVEWLRGLTEAGALRAAQDEAGAWEVDVEALANTEFAGKAGAVLSGRLHLVSQTVARLLAAGAVLGQSFLIDEAKGMATLDDDAAREALAEAERRHLVKVRAAGVCRFTHDRIRESVLARLGRSERARLHGVAVDVIAARGADRTFELAYHADAAGMKALALTYALQAARQARARQVLESAEAQYAIAVRNCEGANAADCLEAVEGLGEVLMLRGRYDEAERSLRQAGRLSEAAHDRARVDGKLGELAFKRGDMLGAAAATERALDMLGQPRPKSMLRVSFACAREVLVQSLHTLAPRAWVGRKPATSGRAELLAARLLSRLAYVYWFRHGRLRCFWAHLRGMNLAERYTPTPELAQAYSEHAPAMTLVPWWRRGQDYAERSLALRKHMHDRWGQGQSLHFLGVLLYSSARFAECVQRCEEAVDLLEETGDRWEANDAACNVSLALYRLGRLEDARELAERTYRKALAIGDTHSVGVCLEVLSKATNGQVDAARVQAALAQPTADVQTRSEVLQAEGVRLLLGERRVHDAVAVFSQAVDAVRRAGLRQEYVVSAYPWLATALRHAWEQLSPYDRARRTVLRRRWRRTVKQSLALAHDFPNNAPHALREAGLLAAAGGGTARARKLLERSVARARGLEMAHEEQLTREALTELEALSGWSAPSNAPHASGEYRRVATPNAVLVEAPSAPHFVFDAAAALKKRADEVDALKAAISAHQDLLSVAAHELRNPLAALTLKLDVLARKVQRGQCAPAELENGLANLGRTAQHLRKLLDTMQDVSGLAKGRIVFDLKPVDLSMLVQEVVERFSEELSRALVDLQLTLTDPIVGTWDLVRLDQVVSNLLVNAIKYGGGKPIQISTCKEQGFAVLHVADQGIGIAAEHQERIFKPFERAVSGRLYAGLGVGLWLSCALVEALGGTLTVQSRLGEGSVFTVRLPLPSATA